LKLTTILTPGHTPGSICFRLEGSPVVFSGDTLFPGGPGNTTFEGGDFDTIIRSLDTKLFPLPEDTIVLPGHGDDTTIGTERLGHDDRVSAPTGDESHLWPHGDLLAGRESLGLHAASLAFCARPGRPHLRERLLVEATD
jgi:glyoxylase-like metal-dependent hydrolase (beta-lactamase superfamily II)